MPAPIDTREAPEGQPRLLDGVVTFVLSDVEGSTQMWEESPDLMMRALDQHDQVIDEAVGAHEGVSVKPRGEGDSRFLVFADAFDALQAITRIQTRLASIDWVTPRPMRIRAALHTGAADLQLGDYYGSTVNRAARLRAIAHGGQSVMSRSTWELLRDRLPEGVTVREGRPGSKHHLLVDASGIPLAWSLTRSNRNDIEQLLPLVAALPGWPALSADLDKSQRAWSVIAATTLTATARSCAGSGSHQSSLAARPSTDQVSAECAGWWSAPSPTSTTSNGCSSATSAEPTCTEHCSRSAAASSASAGSRVQCETTSKAHR
jgi:class 3 adenylate cyclase